MSQTLPIMPPSFSARFVTSILASNGQVRSRSIEAALAVLEELGVDVNSPFGRHETTPLMAASLGGDAAMCCALLVRGATATIEDTRGLSALALARHTAAAPAFGLDQTRDHSDDPASDRSD